MSENGLNGNYFFSEKKIVKDYIKKKKIMNSLINYKLKK